MKLTACSIRPISIVARLMKATISPTVAWPRRFSHVPSRKMARMVSVAEARVATAASAHQDSTGSWAARSWSMMPLSSRASCSMRVKLWITGTLPSASEAWAARLE